MEKSVKILNDAGLHARPAAAFVKKASEFVSDIVIEEDTKKVNAKSIMNVLSVGIKKDAEIKIIANGPDEQEAVEALVDLVNSKFGE
ncbi:HPr family phosphocarrier protein [Marinisporobacter balticus]|uniref:Phosphocarrier protein HPr n=1 Tax=Marinisporobacter balticus TaxID=2018667 RepID=A0A4R2KZT6_9FIRM|nr:HPr family phosphocarrier protein [Marinisporobacter balticus]TCO76906.1 phosphocarrier protein [Marinisporobacter balticus]